MENNNDIGAMLSKLLEDPAALSRVMSLAGTLMDNLPKDAQTEAEASKPIESSAETQTQADTSEDAEAVPAFAAGQASSSPDLSALKALTGLSGMAGKKSDPRCNLLTSLRPYMGHGRAEKIDMMIKALNLAELAGGFLNNKKLF